MNTRIYLVQTKGKEQIEDTVLVEAQTAAQALRFVTQSQFETRAATSKEVATYMRLGSRLYDATAVIEGIKTNDNG